jgi:hypothetical protein
MSAKKKPTKGLLDYFDIALGRMSDSDSTKPGLRKRSWGTTFLFLCLLPALCLAGAVSISMVMGVWMQRTPIKKKVSTVKKKGSRLSRLRSKKSSSPALNVKLDIGWPPVALVLGILLVGVFFKISRSKEERETAKMLGELYVSSKTGGVSEDKILPFLQDAMTKVTPNGKPPASFGEAELDLDEIDRLEGAK